MKGKYFPSGRRLFNEHFNARYIRHGDWKLVSLANDTTWRLYKLDDDETEINDFSEYQPGIVKKMTEQWYIWANAHNVFPKRKN